MKTFIYEFLLSWGVGQGVVMANSFEDAAELILVDSYYSLKNYHSLDVDIYELEEGLVDMSWEE